MAKSPFIAQGIQPQQQDNNTGALKFGTGVGLVAASGFIPYKNKRLWDKYIAGVRAVETGFPAAILRTFRVSEFLSPLETYSSLNVSREQLQESGKYSNLLKNIFGEQAEELTLTRRGAVFGDVTDQVGRSIGAGIRIKAGTQKGSGISDFFARAHGIELGPFESLNDALLRAEYNEQKIALSFPDWIKTLSPEAKQKDILIGAKYREGINLFGHNIILDRKTARLVAKAEVAKDLFAAKAATTASRLNNLLHKPLELPIIGERLQKIPILKDLAVKPGTATEMLGRYVKKGLIVAAAWKGLEYLDYMRAEGNQAESSVFGTLGGAAAGAFLFKKSAQKFSALGLVAGAAIGLAASVAPRFEHGYFHGVASYGTDFNVARAKVSEKIGLTESLQKQEAVAPGLGSLSTAIGFAGVGALTVGFADYSTYLATGIKESIGSRETVASVLEVTRDLRKEKIAEKIWGSTLGRKATKRIPVLSKVKHPMLFGAMAGLALWGGINLVTGAIAGNAAAAIPGAGIVGTTDTPEELEAIYSGEKEVAIRKGRWWEFGRSTAYEGGDIEYYRPHMIHRLKTRAYQKGLWGTEEEKWEHDPILNPGKAVFGSDDWKYYYEKKYQHERPAPLTSTYGEEVPFIGPLLAASVGKLLKPRKKIREEEWDLGNGQYVHRPEPGKGIEPDPELGGLGPGAPVAPEEGTQLFNELMYRRREGVGLVGFAEGAIQKAVTGREEVFANQQTMATMGKETGGEYWLWDHLNIGGGLGSSEVVRRFIPHERRYLDKYNPLSNSMPSWLPNTEKELRYGNPFDKIKEAEIRLPGPGYSALHPELEGVNPEDYPAIHRLKILGDVAMWSPEYRSTLKQVKGMPLSEKDHAMLISVEEQEKEKKKRGNFSEYRFNKDQLTSQEVTVSKVLDPSNILTREYGNMVVNLQGVGSSKNAQETTNFAISALEGKRIKLQIPSMESRAMEMTPSGGQLKAVAMLGDEDYGSRLVEEGLAEAAPLQDEFEQLRFSSREKLAGKIAEVATHNAEMPWEQLTPISPASKLIRKRSAIEDYVTTQAVGTGNAFWDRPLENFIVPFANMAERTAGDKRIPSGVRDKREIQKYFDMLKWEKQNRIESASMQRGDTYAAQKARLAKKTTVFGADVFGPPGKVKGALPRAEQVFFDSFAGARTDEDRAEILGLIPENERRIYMSQWLRQAESAAMAKKVAKIDTDEDNRVLSVTSKMRKSEGFQITEDLEKQWLNETNGDIPYDEWIRSKQSEEYFDTHSLPDPSWLGWCVLPDQELLTSNSSFILANDVKLNQTLATLQGEKQVKQIFKRETDEKITTIKVQHNDVYCMSATSNHIVLGINTEKCKYNLRFNSVCTDKSKSWKCNFCTTKYYESYFAEWMPIKDITTNTYLPVPLLKHSKDTPIFDIGLLDCFPKNTIIDKDTIYPKTGLRRPMKRNILMDEATCWLIGYYLAEGNVWAVKDRMRGIQFSSHINEVPILELAQKIIKNKFGLSSVIRLKENKNSAYLVVSSGLFGWLINYWVGRFCDKKFAPSWLENITLKSQVAMLDGLNTGDASKDSRERLVLANKQLCYMAKRIYEAQGIPASLYGPKKRNGKDQYSVGALTSSLSAIVGDNFIAYRVKEIDISDYKGTVLDFEIKDDHMYCSPIGIYHNSPSVDLEDVKLKAVTMSGMDFHDFDLWDARARSLARKPYINEELIEAMDAYSSYENESKQAMNARAMGKMFGDKNFRVNTSRTEGNMGNSYNFQVADGRKNMIEEAYRKMGA